MREPLVAQAWLSLGANLGDREGALAEAARRLAGTPGVAVTARSALYRTPPWGDPNQPEFMNAALGVATTLPPHGLLDACLAIEAALGRTRGRRWGPRVLDIDIVDYEGAALADRRLTLPHPHWRERAFVLAPLAEIAPDLVIGGIRVADALAAVESAAIRRVGGGVPA